MSSKGRFEPINANAEEIYRKDGKNLIIITFT
jgi:hypothetical protein